MFTWYNYAAWHIFRVHYTNQTDWPFGIWANFYPNCRALMVITDPDRPWYNWLNVILTNYDNIKWHHKSISSALDKASRSKTILYKARDDVKAWKLFPNYWRLEYPQFIAGILSKAWNVVLLCFFVVNLNRWLSKQSGWRWNERCIDMIMVLRLPLSLPRFSSGAKRAITCERVALYQAIYRHIQTL